jgi:hypothetical protein
MSGRYRQNEPAAAAAGIFLLIWKRPSGLSHEANALVGCTDPGENLGFRDTIRPLPRIEKPSLRRQELAPCVARAAQFKGEFALFEN